MAKLSDLQWGDSLLKMFEFERKTRKGPVKVKVAIRALTPGMIDQARVNGESYVASLDLSDKSKQTRDEILADAIDLECMALALMDPDKPTECWAGSASLRAMLTTTEHAVLLRAYNDHQDEQGLNLRAMSPERFQKLLREIAETQSTDPLLFCDSATRRDFIITSASLLWSSQLASSSTSSEPQSPSEKNESADAQPEE